MKNRSLTIKIFAAIALTFLILGIAIYGFIYVSFPKRYMENKKECVQEQAEMCLTVLENTGGTYEELKERLTEVSLREGVSIDVFIDGVLGYSINSVQSYNIDDVREDVQVDMIVDRELDKYEKVCIKRIYGKEEIIAEIYVPVEIVEDIEGVLLSTYPATMAITVFMIVVLSIIAAWQIARPIVRIINKVNDMSLFRHVPKKENWDESLRDEIKLLDKKLENMYYLLHESQMNMERELKNQMKQEKLRFDFLRMAAHELKTPITSVNGILEGMYYNVPPYNNREHYILECQYIISNMNGSIKDMLVLTGCNSQYTREYVNIKKIIAEIIDIFSVERIKKNIKLCMDVSDDFVFYTNKEILESALKNIVHNSVIYCEINGIINITLKNGCLHIFNSCMPLREEQINKIFEAFYRGESSNVNGNGLGLYLVKRFLDMLNISFSFNQSCIDENIEGMDFVIDLEGV